MAVLLPLEKTRERISSSESMHKIIDDLFAENYEEYMEHPERLLNHLKECILPFRKSCKSLNLSKSDVAHGDLVRMRCMIHDTKGFEVFPTGSAQASETGNRVSCGMFRDFIETADLDVRDLKIATRYKYVVGPVPGASAWYDDPFYNMAVKADGKDRGQSNTGMSGSFKIIAKFFEESCSELKPNHVFDLFGIMDTTEIHNDEDMENSETEHHRLHVIAFEAVEDHKAINQEFPPISSDKTDAINLVRKSLSLLFGDDNAAEYLLCHLVSRTYSRPVGFPVCSMPTNIINVTDSNSIIRHIRLLMPKVQVLEVSEDTLCSAKLIPKMNYEKDVLEDGVLQLSNGTILLIDETKFSWSSVAGFGENEKKIFDENCEALRRLVNEQVFVYDYTHYPITLECDINVLVLSKAPSRLKLGLPFTVAIPPQFCDGIDPAEMLEQGQVLKECRHALQGCRNSVEHVIIPDGINKEVTETFVKNRSSGTASGDACDQLHRLLTLSRLLTALDGKIELGLEQWRKAQELEKERLEILREFVRSTINSG